MGNCNDSFKLIALKVGKNCHEDIRRNIETDKWYFFDQDYNEDNGEIVHSKRQCVPEDFFFLKDKEKLHINIHAIVGKNGSGKSTIIDIALMLINNYAYKAFKKIPGVELSHVDKLEATLAFTFGDKLYYLQGSEKEFQVIDLECKKIIDLECKKKQDFFYTILLNYSLYAYNTGEYYPKAKGLGEYSKSTFPLEVPQYNDRERVDLYDDTHWLGKLFHKNDGYCTPIVINPKRRRGNIEVNLERELSEARFLSVLHSSNADTNFVGLLDKAYEIEKFKIRQNPLLEVNGEDNIDKQVLAFIQNKRVVLRSGDRWVGYDENNNLFKYVVASVRTKWFDHLGSKTIPSPIENLQDTESLIEHKNRWVAFAYLIYKTLAIASNYADYLSTGNNFWEDFTATYQNDEKQKKLWSDFIEILIKDRSHATYKLHQTLNYLKIGYKAKAYKGINGDFKELSIEEFQELSNDKYTLEEYKGDKIYSLPPSFFEIEVYVRRKKEGNDKGGKEKGFPISNLSSGERQLIHTIGCVLYHLHNLNSIEENSGRVRYEYVNLVFDEIELYFHPEYQRQFINRLVSAIRGMNFNHIKGINILLATHSPFILSDIPKSKILFLDNGKAVTQEIAEETFASNIHTLLRQAFFLDGGTMGEFAKEKIKRLAQEIAEITEITKGTEAHNAIEQQIKLIGEPILRRELQRKLQEKQSVHNRLSKLKEEIK